MFSKKSTILIIGTGSIGMRHAKNLHVLGFRNLAVADPAIRDDTSFPFPVRLYKDVRIALKNEKPAVVFVCAPTHLHVPLARLALKYNADIFIEKPLSHSLAGVDALIREVQKKKRVVMVGCNFRFNKGFQAFERLLKQKRYGTPLYARVALGYYLPTARKNVNYKNVYAAGTKGGGVVLDSGSHTVDYLAAIFGPVIKKFIFKSSEHSLGIQSEEIAQCVFEHANGIISVCSFDYVSRRGMHRVEIVTDRGILTLEFRDDILTFDDGMKKKVLYHGPRDPNRAFIDELKHFFGCLEKRKKPMQDLKGAREVLRALVGTV